LVVRVPDHLRYGSDGLVTVVGGVETRVLDEPVAWASSDGEGGFAYSAAGHVWWQPAGTDDAALIDGAGWYARSVDGRPTLIVSTDEAGCGDDGYFKLALHDLASGDERLFGCVGGSGDSTSTVTDVGGRRYLVEGGMDLANYSTDYGLTIRDLDATDEGSASGSGLPGNPYPDSTSCRVQREGEPMAACEVHGRLSPDGALLATWYRPDFSMVVDPMGMPPEVVADHAGWLARLETLGAEVTVHDLDSGVELYRTELTGRTRIVDFDGRFLVVAPCRGPYDGSLDCPSDGARWTIIDTSGRQPPFTVSGRVALLRPRGDGEPTTHVDAPMLRRGDRGAWVSFLQQALVLRGWTVEVDGIFGPATEAAVREIQQGADTEVDGTVGFHTWAALIDSSTIGATAVLRPGGLGPVDFGTPAERALAELGAILGPPTVDEMIRPGAECVEGSSWEDCLRANDLLEQGRIVRWTDRGLSIAFTDAEWSGAELTPTPLQFSSWRAVRPAGGGRALTTVEGIGPGATIGDLRATYSDLHWGFNEGVWDSVGFLIITGDDCGGCFESGIWSELDHDPEEDGFEIAYTKALQRALNAQGADLAVDGEIGPRTQLAWEQFCAAHALSCDADWPGLPWNMTGEQRAALEFPPPDVAIAAMVS
jgi:peptidoglycan hydrolase-like protein with peptidoglycan-binding domain